MKNLKLLIPLLMFLNIFSSFSNNTNENTANLVWFTPAQRDLLSINYNQFSSLSLQVRNKMEKFLENGSNSQQATANAFLYLITNDRLKARKAVELVLKTERSNANPNSEDNFLGHADRFALIYNWCYNALTSDQKKLFTDILLKRYAQSIQYARSHLSYHEEYASRSNLISLLIALDKHENALLRYNEVKKYMNDFIKIMNEESPNGAHTSYYYQYRYQILPFLMWDRYYNDTLSHACHYVKQGINFISSKLGYNKANLIYSEGDIAVWGTQGYVAPQQNPGALYGWLIAQHFEDKKALEYGNQYFKKNGKISPVYDDPVWLALPIKKHDLEYEKTAYNLFEVKEFGQQMVYIKSSRPHQKPLKIWLYNTPYLSHTSYSQNHFELWQGPDDLFIRGGNYLGSPSVYKRYFSSSFARNTIAFVPKNTSQPDLKGGQNLKDVNYRLDTTFYPDAVRLNSYRMHRYRGHFNFSEVDTVKKYGIFCGDASVVYPQADYYSRDFIFIYPGLLIINDRFEMKDHQNIEKIRWIFHSRHIPKIEESWITKEGNIEEGIHHANQIEEVVLQQNNSQVKIRTLQNSANKLITQGGGKYSSYMDDRFYIPERDCQNWMKGTKHLINRKMYIADQYTSWFEYDMTQQIKHLAFLLTIDDMSTNTVQILKTYSDSSHKFLTVKYLGQTIKIGLPRNNKSNPYVKFL